MKKVAILQSNYIPWKGYFDMINMVDLFIFYDDVQYTTRDWRNRNKIKTPNGPRWITIPCGADRNRLICEVELTDSEWQRQHWSMIENNYRKTHFFHQYKTFFKDVYLGRTWKTLSELNQVLIKTISIDFLNIGSTVFDDSRNYVLTKRKANRILELLEKVQATEYLSGPAGKDYLTDEAFQARNIKLTWMDYSRYPEHPQLYPPFEHNVSIIDLLFNVGDAAPHYMKSFS